MTQLSLELSHFICLSVLSCTDHFSRVELVRHTARVTPAYVLKSTDKSWSWKMRKQCCALNELAVLRNARDDPNAPVPRLIGSFLSQDCFHLVMEHAEGGDLYSLLERNPKGLPEQYVQSWTAEAAEAIGWLHTQGWCHRDIKPHNLLLQATGRILLTDFGSAAKLDASGFVAEEDAQVLIGTPDYVAPEILLFAEKLAQRADRFSSPSLASSRKAYSSAVDWWSLGVTAYELLTGQSPFFAESIPETYERIIQHNLTLSFPGQCSSAAQACLRTLMTDVSERVSFRGLRQSAWLAEQPWGGFAMPTTKRPFIPPPLDLTKLSSPMQHQSSTANAFDFTAFFSSPGLSILRTTSRASGKASDEQEAQAAYWSQATTLPPPSEFGSRQRPARSASGAAHSFETPMMTRYVGRAFATHPSSTTSGTTATTTSKRARRGVEGLEAWREMADHAWSTGRQRRQAQSGRPDLDRYVATESRHGSDGKEQSTGIDDLAVLESRHRALERDLDMIDRKYSHLFVTQ